MSDTATDRAQEARLAANHILDADEKLYDLVREFDEALFMARPNFEVRQLVDDLDAQVIYVRRQLDKIERFTTKERTRHGW